MIHLYAEERETGAKDAPDEGIRRQGARRVQRVTFHEKRKNTCVASIDAETKKCAKNKWYNPVHVTVGCPSETKKSQDNKPYPDYAGRKTKLRIRATGFAACSLALPYQSAVVTLEEWVGEHTQHHSDQETEECKTVLGDGEAMMLFENDGVGAEEEVEDSEEDSGQKTEIKDHGLEKKELKRADARPEDGFRDGAIEFLNGSLVVFVTGFFAETAGFSAEEHRMVCLWDKEDDEAELDARPDEEEVEGPAPGRVLVDETAEDGSDGGADERAA